MTFELSRATKYRLFLAVTVIGMIQGIVVCTVGATVKYQLGSLLAKGLNADPVNYLYSGFFTPARAPIEAPLMLLSENFGTNLLCLGVVVAVLSNFGFAGALYVRPLLVLFMLMMGMVIMIELVTSVFILNSQSTLNLKGKEAFRDMLGDLAYLSDSQKLDDSWYNGLHILMIALDCCGVDGPHDFKDVYPDKPVPETCCRRDVVRQAAVTRQLQACSGLGSSYSKNTAAPPVVGDSLLAGCVNDTFMPLNLTLCTHTQPHAQGFTKLHKTLGCYNAIFDHIMDYLPWILSVISFVITTQAGMVVGAMFVYNQRITWATCTQPEMTKPV